MSYIDPDDNTAAFFGSYPVTGTDWVAPSGTRYYSTTPMMLDILAIQRVYGAATSGPLTGGGKIFGFHSNIGGDVGSFFDFKINQHPIVTIWATGTNNKLDLSGFSADATINLAPGSFSSADNLVNNIAIALDVTIEHAAGGSGNDRINGTDLSNILEGNGGVDTIKGAGGHDQLSGGLGNDMLWGEDGDDYLRGGAGADQLVGGNGTDTVQYDDSPAAVTVDLTLSGGTGGDAQGDSYAEVENAQGSIYDDTLIGNGNGNSLFGDQGDDTLIGGGGADNLNGGIGSDTVTCAASGAGVQIDLFAGTGHGGDAEGDLFTSVENVIGSNASDSIYGDTTRQSFGRP